MFGTLQLERKWIDIHKVIPFSCLLHLLWIKWPFLWIVIQFNWRKSHFIRRDQDWLFYSINLSFYFHSLLSHFTSLHFLSTFPLYFLYPLSQPSFSLLSLHFPTLLSLSTSQSTFSSTLFVLLYFHSSLSSLPFLSILSLHFLSFSRSTLSINLHSTFSFYFLNLFSHFLSLSSFSIHFTFSL